VKYRSKERKGRKKLYKEEITRKKKEMTYSAAKHNCE
jgi:hypothetical protein